MWRAIVSLAVKQARDITDDQEALKVQALYKQWEKQFGRQLEVGEYVQYDNKLFRVLQAHAAQEAWVPGIGTESLYVVIDKSHTGLVDDPIPYNCNMEIFEGLYYIENDIVYLCTRNSDIALHNNLSDLVDIYVIIK